MKSDTPIKNSCKCPICGSNDCHVFSEQRNYPIPYGPLTIVNEQYTSCDNCGEKASVSDQIPFNAAIATAKWESAKGIIEYLCNHGHSCAGIERVLGLPQRTLSQWRSSHEPAAAGLALLRLIRTFPWLLDVAAESFSNSAARKYLFNAAMELIGNSLSFENKCLNFEGSVAAVVDVNNGCRQGMFVGMYSEQQTVTGSNFEIIETKGI